MDPKTMEISIVMPALNEEDSVLLAINDTMNAFDDLKMSGEVIVVNDGSSDGTEQLVRGMMKKEDRLRLICHDLPQGIGASFWDGVEIAKGEVVSMFPGDNENNPWEVLRYYGLLKHVDMVIPFVFNKEVRSIFRNFLSLVYRFIINTTFFVNFNYTNGTILYRKSLLDEIESRNTGFFFQTDILIRTAKKGYLFAEVPYRLSVREGSQSKACTFPSLMKVVKGYINLVREIYFNSNDKVKLKFAPGSQTEFRKDPGPFTRKSKREY